MFECEENRKKSEIQESSLALKNCLLVWCSVTSAFHLHLRGTQVGGPVSMSKEGRQKHKRILDSKIDYSRCFYRNLKPEVGDKIPHKFLLET